MDVSRSNAHPFARGFIRTRRLTPHTSKHAPHPTSTTPHFNPPPPQWALHEMLLKVSRINLLVLTVRSMAANANAANARQLLLLP